MNSQRSSPRILLRSFFFTAVVIFIGASVCTWHSSADGPGLTTFTNNSASWLYSAPTGPYTDISSQTQNLTFVVDSHAGSWDYPVQFTDGTHGTTTFDDFHWYNRTDQIAVPNVQDGGGGFAPSTGSDGHLVVVDTSTRMFYDFWKLCVNSSGVPITCSGNYSPTSIGQILSGSLNMSNGAPGGDTSSGISGLAGVILPNELNTGEAVPHALSVVVPASMANGNICTAAPATHTDGSVSGAVFCQGAKIRMDPSINVDSLSASPAAKAIMKALQIYGGVIVDQSGGSGVAFYSSLQTDPDLTGLAQNLGPHVWIYYSN